MPTSVASIHVKVQGKKLTVLGMGQTNRGQKYIKKAIPIKVAKMSDEQFKTELAAAVNEILS